MQDVITRLEAHDVEIGDLAADMSALSKRLDVLGSQVERLQAVVDASQSAVKAQAVPESLAASDITSDAGLRVAEMSGASAPETRSEPWQEVIEPALPTQVEPTAPSELVAEPVEAVLPTTTAVEPRLPGGLKSEAPQSEPISAQFAVPDARSTDEPVAEHAPVAEWAEAPGSSSRAASLEQRLSTNWLVWVGGVALALAGVFLVRYIAEQGWLSAATRCAIGVIAGFGLIIAGEVVRRRPLERAIAAIRADYVPQALTSGGLVTAFGSVYLAYAFYDLIPSSWSFILLGAIALAAFVLSTVQGSFVALLGLVGAAVTPALVSTDDPSAWGFFSYLGIIVLAAMAVAARRQWYWLPQLALLVIAGWSGLWINGGLAISHIAPIGTTLGIVAFVGLLLAMRAKSNRELADIVAWIGLAVAAAAAFAMALKSEFAPQTHWLFLSYTVATAFFARFASRFAMTLAVMAVLSVGTLALSYIDESAIANIIERALGTPAPTQYFVEKFGQFVTHATLIGLVAFTGGVLSLSRAAGKMTVAVTTAATPLFLLVVGYAQFRNYSGDGVWVLATGSVLIAATLATAYLRRSTAEDTEVQGIYAAVAVIAAFLAATFQFDRVWLTLAYAGLVMAVGLVSVRVDLPILRRLANLIVMIVLLRLTVNADLRGYETFHPLGMQWVTYGYLVPLALFVAASRLLKRAKDDLTVTVLEGAALLLGIAFVSIEIRIFMTGQIYSGEYGLPEMSLQTIAWLTSALILARRNLRYPRLFSLWGSRLLVVAGATQAMLLQLIIFNPVFTGDMIQGYGLINMLILSLLAPAVLLWLLAGSLLPEDGLQPQASSFGVDSLRSFAMLLVFAFVTEEVRVLFQGMIIVPKHASLLELYVTTLAWAIPAAVPYLWARTKPSRAIQMLAAVVLSVATIGAVLGHGLVFNPTLTGDEVRGIPFLNTLLLGFLVPAALFYMASASPRMAEPVASVMLAASYVMVFMGLWLMTKQAFQGARLVPLHESLLELYVVTLVWLMLSAALLALPKVRDLSAAEQAAHAILAVSVVMLFAGHALIFNPAMDGSFVPGWPVFNVLLLGFIAPAGLIGLISRWARPDMQTPMQIAAYVLLFFGVTMLVKHTFQGGIMVVETLSNREDYAYSAAWLVLAIATLIGGIVFHKTYARYASLAVLIVVMVKVFILDMSGLAGLWRVASLFGLGICLIGIGWVYQRFVFAPVAKAGKATAPQTVAGER